MAVQLQYPIQNLSQKPQIQLEYDRHIQAPYRIRAERTVMEAELLFDQERSLKCLVVIDDTDCPLGLIMRDRFYEVMSKRFAPALFHHKSITRLMDEHAMQVEYGMDTAELLDQAILRPEEQVYDSIIVKKEDKLYGVIGSRSITALSKQLRDQLANQERQAVHMTMSTLTSIRQEADKVQQVAAEGLKHADLMIDQTLDGKTVMDRVTRSVKQVSTQIEEQELLTLELRRHMEAVSSSVHIIRGWSDRCRILALNASIEAVQAGVNGRGFQIVAHEVGELAKMTKSATEQIEQRIEIMNQSLEKTVTGSQLCMMEARDTVSGLSVAVQQFEQLFQAITVNRSSTAEMDQTSVKMAAAAEEAFKQLELNWSDREFFTQR